MSNSPSLIVSRLRRYFSGSVSTVVFECRRCGTTVGSTNDSCPTCGSANIARYEFDH